MYGVFDSTYVCHDQVYERARYAGSVFRSERSHKSPTNDDSCIRQDYRAPGVRGNAGVVLSAYARIRKIFVHQAYAGGPSRIVIQGNWHTVMGKCEIAGTTLIRPDRNQDFNTSAKFAFLQNCYQRPVAFWPYDPLHKLEEDDARRKWLDVIDRNQTETS